ncbi:hypothetical protein GOQ09_13425 [Variovorax paradoxus]|uniref:Uncharacterized protein n=1 Tax=Variovorax paradoxus TaxID=34073 RepID=A0A6I6HPY7_VARPD|nr:hypothetical protein GOQ09_13425 [Variovorax paradoxus]
MTSVTFLVAVASPDYLERRGTPRSPSDLRGHACSTMRCSRLRRTWMHRQTRISGAQPPLQSQRVPFAFFSRG